ncbi:LysE family translocator [Clostridium tyrobutyricum]|uniref:LysE family translocator n=1 Tax=Clostridium tyrobutyricum TaxID=1519 RepID=UPI001C3CCBAC|nr:LysE family transporter [Clostridium tyrobutyricum]MBV4436161.1 LysE family translocator [Clostridium tyrobutyricum]
MFINLFRGILIGLIVGMPVGPIGAICLKNTITFGRKYGLTCGFGSASADSIYAFLVSFGLMIITKFIFLYQSYFHIIGGIILICFGIHISLKTTSNIKKKSISNNTSLFKGFISTFLLALSNPATVFSFIVIFTALHLVNISTDINSKIILIIGVFIGSMLWWFILIFTTFKFNNKLNVKSTFIIDKILSFIVIFSGIVILLSAFKLFHLRNFPALHSKLFQFFFKIKTLVYRCSY